MYNEIKTQLENEVKVEIDNLEQMTLGDKTYEVTVDGIAKLTDRVIKMKELEIAEVEKEKRIELEAKKAEEERIMKEKQRRDELIDKIVKNTLTGVSVVGGFAITVWGVVASFDFEGEGKIISSMAGRGFINKLIPKK